MLDFPFQKFFYLQGLDLLKKSLESNDLLLGPLLVELLIVPTWGMSFFFLSSVDSIMSCIIMSVSLSLLSP